VGAGPQVSVEGEKLMFVVEGSAFEKIGISEAVPENVKLPTSVGNEPVTVSVNVPEAGAVNGTDAARGNPLEPGETSIE
jgi:hypothetical protein